MRTAPILIVTLLAGASAAAIGRDDPRSIKLDPDAKDGVLLVRMPPSPVDYKLVIQREGSGGFGSRVYYLDARTNLPGERPGYEARKLSAGRYVLKGVMQQDAWLGCLDIGTMLFTIQAGKINYLGAIDVRPTLNAIQAAALAAGDTTARPGQSKSLTYFDVLRPSVGGREADDLAQVERFVKEGMPRAQADVVLAPVEEHRFGSPDLSHREKRRC